MSKVLQLRRGSAANHNNFSGLAGEITFDTDAKTLRVHDGETLGGFEIARADLSNVDTAGFGAGGENPGYFDINSVSAEFWDALFREYNQFQSNFGISENCTIANTSYLEYFFDTAAPISFEKIVADMVLVNQTPEAGYSIGDIVHAFGIGARACPRPNVIPDEGGVRVRQMVNNESFWVSHKTTGASIQITNSNWKTKFRIWY